MVHKTLREKCPENHKGKFINLTQFSKYENRRLNNLQLSRPLLEISKKRFSYVGAKIWNEIPNNVRNMESTHLFKQKNENLPLGPIK